MGRTKDKEKKLAKVLYFETSKTLEEIAAIAKVNRSTISGWIKNEGWDTIREVQKQTPERVVQDLYAELEELNSAIRMREEGMRYATSKESDSRNKIILSIHRLQNKIALPQYVTVLMNFLDYVQQEDLDLSKKVAKVANNFLSDKIEDLTRED